MSNRVVVVIGGTGILAPAVRELAGEGTRCLVVTRDECNVDRLGDDSNIVAVVVDVNGVTSWRIVMERVARRGLVDAVAYMPFAGPAAWETLAGSVSGVFVPVLTSAAADPTGPLARVPRGTGPVRAVVLGWNPTPADTASSATCRSTVGELFRRTRWHTPAEVSEAALQALHGDGEPVGRSAVPVQGADTVLVLGSVTPWRDRPTS